MELPGRQAPTVAISADGISVSPNKGFATMGGSGFVSSFWDGYHEKTPDSHKTVYTCEFLQPRPPNPPQVFP
jgi:hypothetical protein